MKFVVQPLLCAVVFLATTGVTAFSYAEKQRVHPPVRAHFYNKHREAFRPFVISISKRFNVSPALTEAVIHTESYYDPEAVSRVGAMGLMQLMRPTARYYGVYNRRDPIKNIEAGVQYLRDLMVMFDNDLELVLAAYNAGETAVKRYGNRVPPYAETQDYVRKVRRKMNQLKGTI
ncbi:lytic transglycosylase domain-containing protein [Teredinibacter haidensis]|uniref:lytic transglycosylase domain-containing protein n=1 Tax=Teredinibacter haidensis TaxID=2731755 RepID=UPI000948AEE3|nr:lytic transglycosylase domain-containing protein [Teredinibacter haidensis]